MKNKVYCIIVTYNSLKWIDKCLNSLASSTIKVEPVIIDNNSKDDTVNYLKKNYPDVYLIENKENRGFGQANNQGIEYAYKQGGTHFFLLNQDAWVEPDAIEKLVNVQDKYNLALVSPLHLNGTGDKYDYSFFVKIVIDEINRDYVSDLFHNTLKPYYAVDKINAAAWMLSRKTIEEIGGFDPVFFHYGEDGNYCQRVHYHKHDIVFVPDSIIHHDREMQGNVEVYNKKNTLMSLLYEYCDVNQCFLKITKRRIRLHLALFNSFISFLFRGQLGNAFNIISSYFVFWSKIPRILRNMKKNKQAGLHWLNIE